ncbi:P-loop containing nucleoside triphosphate hydrolase protein [Amylocystis lapponica]|nr:P-loop containing nucleoside triphosphate hydrolase protein [Amylocystis lapponica]
MSRRHLAPTAMRTPVTKSQVQTVNQTKHDEEIAIAVMGATGSGKSTFINLVSGSHLDVGNGLKSCTSSVETSRTFELFGRRVTLIDTPGFDDTTKSDTDILKMIALYLSTIYENGRKLSGVIYIHRISDFRMTGISRRNFSMFRKLCGDDTLKNVIIATNMWSEVSEERGAARELELATDEILFKPVLDLGAQMLRHDNTRASAVEILLQLINNHPRALSIQKQLVDEGRQLEDTDAGEELSREMAELVRKQRAELAQVQEEMREALLAKDEETRKELDQVRMDLEANVKRIESDRERLSSEYADEKKRSDAKIQEVMAALAAEEAAREARQARIDELHATMRDNAAASEAERSRMKEEIETLRQQSTRNNALGFFGGVGRALDRFFRII